MRSRVVNKLKHVIKMSARLDRNSVKQMETWPLHRDPAPMPMVGICSAWVAAAATGEGTHSRTTAKQPASCKASAASTTCVRRARVDQINSCNEMEERKETNTRSTSNAMQRHLKSTVDRLPLRPEPAEHADRLWCEPDVPHHGYPGLHDRPGRAHSRRRAAFQLHRIHAAFFHEPHRGFDSLQTYKRGNCIVLAIYRCRCMEDACGCWSSIVR
jgi:hypothetical protein